MGERYVAIDGKSNKLAKPLVEFNDTDTKTLATGEEWDLGGGFNLTANQIDLEGEKVWLSLKKNGKEIDNEVIDTGDTDLQERVYTYTADLAGEEDIPVFSCYVSGILRGTDSNIVQVKYVFLIDNDILQISTGESTTVIWKWYRQPHLRSFLKIGKVFIYIMVRSWEIFPLESYLIPVP